MTNKFKQYLPGKPDFNFRLMLHIPQMIQNNQFDKVIQLTQSDEWKNGLTAQIILFFQKISKKCFDQSKNQEFTKFMWLFLDLYLSWYHQYVGFHIRIDRRLAHIDKIKVKNQGNFALCLWIVKIKDPQDEACPYCLKAFEPDEELVILGACEHIFHENCIKFYANLIKQCPVCLIPIKTRRI